MERGKIMKPMLKMINEHDQVLVQGSIEGNSPKAVWIANRLVEFGYVHIMKVTVTEKSVELLLKKSGDY